MVSMYASSVEDHLSRPRSGQTKEYKIGIFFYYGSIAKQVALRSNTTK